MPHTRTNTLKLAIRQPEQGIKYCQKCSDKCDLSAAFEWSYSRRLDTVFGHLSWVSALTVKCTNFCLDIFKSWHVRIASTLRAVACNLLIFVFTGRFADKFLLYSRISKMSVWLDVPRTWLESSVVESATFEHLSYQLTAQTRIISKYYHCVFDNGGGGGGRWRHRGCMRPPPHYFSCPSPNLFSLKILAPSFVMTAVSSWVRDILMRKMYVKWVLFANH